MSKPVTLYTTPTCGYCKATKAFLQEKNIPYTEIDVSSSQDKAKEMIERSGQMGVPVIVVGTSPEEQLIVGFDQSRLSEALGL
jgi:glutaredoxin 3